MNITSVAPEAGGRLLPPAHGPSAGRAFTLIELILVMAILTIAISLTAPALANFFRGRSLDSEARRVLALTRQGQSRAVSEGVPVELWLDTQEGKFGLETEPSFETEDSKAVEFTLAEDMTLEAEAVTKRSSRSTASTFGSTRSRAGALIPVQQLTRRQNLPRIRFNPDGSIDEASPETLKLTGRDGRSMSLTQTRNGLSYEIATRN